MIARVLIVLMVMGVMCIFLGAGLVINTISALIARQVQQIGIIRSVGGLRRQITLMYLSSVLAYSVAALLIAIPLGLVGAKALAGSIGGILNFDVTRATLPPSVALLQVGVGLLVPFVLVVAHQWLLPGAGAAVLLVVAALLRLGGDLYFRYSLISVGSYDPLL